MSSAPGRALVLLHIRKTAGTTLAGALGNRFAADDCLFLYDRAAPEERLLDRYRFVTGHLDVGALKRFRRRPYVVTCLRDPIERSLSTYSFFRWFPPGDYEVLLPQLGPVAYERRVEAMRLARELPLEEFLLQAPELAHEYLGNLQTRIFSGIGIEPGGERLDVALEALMGCDFIGITERLDESAVWLARRLGWRQLAPMPRANVSADRLRRERVSPNALTALEDLTELDALLYRAGLEEHLRRVELWSAMKDPRDPSAAVPDAEPVSDLHFSAPLAGAGWWGRERTKESRWFCWVGDRRSAGVELRPRPDAERLVVEIERLIDEAALNGLTIRANGRPVEHRTQLLDGRLVASTMLDGAAGDPGSPIPVEIEARSSARPCDLDPSSSDARELSIAISRIALERGAGPH